MQLKSKKYLYDISIAARKLSKFIENKSWDDYIIDDQLVWSIIETKLPTLIKEVNIHLN